MFKTVCNLEVLPIGLNWYDHGADAEPMDVNKADLSLKNYTKIKNASNETH